MGNHSQDGKRYLIFLLQTAGRRVMGQFEWLGEVKKIQLG